MTRRRLGSLVTLTPEQLRRARRAQKEGVRIADLARRFDVSADHMGSLLRAERNAGR